jgi:hypothetical protein
VAFKISDLCNLTGINRINEDGKCLSQYEPYEFRILENEVLRSLEFRIGGG